MARKRALVVDDSKSARMVLRKMLERHDIDVDTAESAEDALDYLLHQHPNVIFMDHMMPGMDGFQAVQAIKSDPRTATIPIMMYTSKAGEVYVGEARALGAVGVMPKEVKPADLVKVLETLHLTPVAGAPAPAAKPMPVTSREAEPQRLDRIVDLAREAAEDAVEHFMGGKFEELRQNVREDVQAELHGLIEQLTAATAAQAEPPPRRRRWLLLALAVLVLLVPLAYMLLPRTPPPTPQVSTQPAAEPAAVRDDQSGLLRTLAVQRMRSTQERARLLETVSWALNQSGQYDFGQLAFGDERLAVMSDLLARLSAVGFSGVVRLESHIGKFCLVRDSSGDLRLPPPERPIQDCDSFGYERELAQALGERQSVSFANFLSSSPLVGGKIRLELISRGDEQPRYQYPSTASVATAGQWNALARRNQRVEVSLIPSP